MEKIILASNNVNKIEQIKEFFKDCDVISLQDIGYLEDIEETGNSFLENALIKSKTVSEYASNKGYNYPVFADDSGLEVEALNGEPGIYSARYSGEHGNDKANRDLLLKKLKGVTNKSARYTSCVCLYYPEGNYIYSYGYTYGYIIEEERGAYGFGYDSIFYSYDLNKTFGEATNREKMDISHRGIAIKELLKLI